MGHGSLSLSPEQATGFPKAMQTFQVKLGLGLGSQFLAAPLLS